MTTAIEKELAQCDQPDDMFYGQTIFSFADLRLAADCIAFVRDFNQLIERGTRGPLTPGANEAMDVRHKALAARIKESEE